MAQPIPFDMKTYCEKNGLKYFERCVTCNVAIHKDYNECDECLKKLTWLQKEQKCRICGEPKIKDSFYCQECHIRLGYNRKTDGWTRDSYLIDKQLGWS